MATNPPRQDLIGQGTLVTAVRVGYMDTDMAAWFDGRKTAQDVVAAAALDGVEAGGHPLLRGGDGMITGCALVP
jgi:hypothetical protein